MCMGTDSAADCTAGRCRFQEEIEAEGRARAAELAEEARINRALAPQPGDFIDDDGLNPLVSG